MILDLHNHSIKSDDGRAKVENYCKWIRSRDIKIDGFVLTEHRQFEPTDYSALAAEYDLVILEGSEVETEYGHVLVYGVTEGMMAEFDFARIDIPLAVVLEAAEKHDAIAVPAILAEHALACSHTPKNTAFLRAFGSLNTIMVVVEKMKTR